MPANHHFWNLIAKRYARQPVADEPSYQHKLTVTREHFEPYFEVLEFGCGTGSTALHHAPAVRQILAVDVSSRMLEIARSKACEASIDNIDWQCASIETLSETPERFDAIMAHSILHLLEDRRPVLSKIYRLLKPGGVFVSSTMCVGGRMQWLKPLLGVGRRLGLLPLVRFFTPETLEAEIAQAGFEIDYRWQPGPDKALFLVAFKPE